MFIQTSWPEFPVSGEGVLLSPDTGREFSHKRLISYFKGDRKEGRSVPLALAISSVKPSICH